MRYAIALFSSLLLAAPMATDAQVPAQRILNATAEPQNWLTYGGSYQSQRFSTLKQITPDNVKNLEQKWVLQDQVFGAWESNPLVVDGIMYVTERPNDVIALDAKTGKVFWLYRYVNSPDARVCCGANNRGVAMLGNTLYMGTLDAHLVALDRKTGAVIWDVAVGDLKNANAITAAPLVVKNLVIIGVAGGDFSSRGYIDAYDAQTGVRVWRLNTIPSPGEPGSESWPNPEVAARGGAAAWVTGSYDAALNLVYYGTGNPNPDPDCPHPNRWC